RYGASSRPGASGSASRICSTWSSRGSCTRLVAPRPGGACLARSEHAHLERGARRQACQHVADLLDVLLGHHGDVLDREDDVAAHRDLLPADREGPVTPLQTRVPRGRALGHRLDEEPGGRRDVEDRREAAGEQDALKGTPEHLPGHQGLCALLMVTMKPKPSLPPDFEMFWLTMPMTSPAMLESPVRATRMALVTRSSCRSETSAAALAEMMVARTTSPPM